jgi:hypothetical protein
MSAVNGPGLTDTREEEPPQPSAGQHGAGAWPETSRWVWPAGYVIAAILLFLCYLRVSGTQGVTSDGASIALQGWDILHGNWLLKGWSLADVTFYTTEIPEYMLVEIFRGIGPADVHISAALTYTLLVVLAGLVAKGNKTGKEGLIRVLIASGIMIAPQVGPGAFLLLLSPDHIGTGVPLLLIYLILDRAPRRWWLPPLTGVLLVWVLIADRIALTICVVPIVVVCAVRAYRGIVQRGEPARDQWFEFSLGASALVAVGVSSAIVSEISRLGGFVSAPLTTTFASSSAWPGNFSLTAEGVFGLYGADFTGRSLGVQTGIALLHIAGLALACWAFCRAVRRFFDCDMITQFLVVGIVANIAAFAFSVLPTTYWSDREISAVLPFGAVLAGRLLAEKATRVKLLPALAAVGCCYILALGYGVTRHQAPAHDQALANWLGAHHLTAGLGSYAEGNSVKLDSHDTIQLSAPTWQANGVYPGKHLAKDSDFDPRIYDANFVVTTKQDGLGFYIPPAWIIHAFGQPAHVYHYEYWTIMTYNKNLLTELR